MTFQQTVHSQLRDCTQNKISEALSGTGIQATLGQARFHEGQGIQLNNLLLQLGSGNQAYSNPGSQIEIYEAFLHTPASITELVSNKLNIQAIEIRRAKLTIVRDKQGRWDFEEALDPILALKPDHNSPLPVSLTDCEIRFYDLRLSRSEPVTLTNFNVNLQPIVHAGRPLLQINGSFQSTAISRVEFTTFLDKRAQSWQTRIGATDAKLSRELVPVLPPALQNELQDLKSATGRINFNAQATGRMSLDELPSFFVTGNIAELTIDDARLPLPIRDVACNFVVDNNGFSVDRASGKLGLADFAGNYWQEGLLERQKWHCDGRIDHFNFDHSPRLAQWLPAYCKKFCREYSPSGTSNIEFDLTDDGAQLKRKIVGELTDMSFSYIKLPYKVENCVGKVNWLGNVCDFNVRSFSGNQVIELRGKATGLGQQPTYEINISVPGDLPIDQKMLDAVDAQPRLAKVIRAFSPTGRVSGIGKIEKRIPNGKVTKSFDVRLKQCSIRHDSFDYPIHNIVGLIQARDHEYNFSELSGNNSSGKVTCNGTWNPVSGLNVRFLCNSIPLNDQLRYALKPQLREIWNGFRPRGTLEFMRVDMRLPLGQKEVDLTVEAKMENPKNDAEASYVSIYPVWFPYQIDHLTGTFNIGDGKIKLTDVKGQHQRTWVVCEGDGRYSHDAWSVKLKNLLVGSLKADEDLMDALPSALAPPIRQLRFQGLVNVSGEVSIAGTNVAPGSTQLASHLVGVADWQGDFRTASRIRAQNNQSSNASLAWDLRFDMDQAKMQIGLPIENVFGMVKLVGVYDGSTAECRGEVDIDSLTIYDTQITQIRGPIWLDNERASAGVFALPPENSLSNISPIGYPDAKPSSITGVLHKGTVNIDAQLGSGPKNEYYVQATLADGCLGTACREFTSGLENIEGHSFAAIRLTGDCSGIHSQRGEGTIQLRDSKIYELPVFLALSKILNNRQFSRTAFDSSNIDFTVHGENIDFNRMEFLGDAISLIGNGRMNLDWDIDLNFYSVMGRNKINIPLISELYRASSQKVLWINVDGTLDNPRTHRHVLPQLNESLQQLFQPHERNGLATRLSRFNNPFPAPVPHSQTDSRTARPIDGSNSFQQ